MAGFGIWRSIIASSGSTGGGAVNSVSASSPLSSTGGTDPVISLNSAVPISLGGTNSGTALNNNRVMVSVSDAIVESDFLFINDTTDNLGIGVSSPLAKLHLKAGTATANTASLRIDAGTNLTVPVAGTIEFDGTNLYYTDNTPTRQTLSTGGSGSAITALTGDGTATGPGSVAFTISVGAVTDAKASLLNKPACTVVATTNQALTGTPVIDSQATAAGSLILATAQSAGAENGPWVAAAGAWTRPSWYTSGSTTQSMQFSTTLIRLGATYQGSTWRQTAAGPITIDTTATTWVVTPHAVNASTIAGGVTGTGAVVLATGPTVGTLTTTGTIELGNASDTTIARASAGVASVEGNNIVVNTSSPTLATITTTGNIELGNASDTTLSRSSAGVLAVEGVVIPSISSTNTLTNKSISASQITTGTFGTGAYVMDTSLTNPILIGGTTTTSTLTLKPTSANAAAGGDIIAAVGNNGATEAFRVLGGTANKIGFLGVGTASPSTIMHVLQAGAAGSATSGYTGAATIYVTNLVNQSITVLPTAVGGISITAAFLGNHETSFGAGTLANFYAAVGVNAIVLVKSTDAATYTAGSFIAAGSYVGRYEGSGTISKVLGIGTTAACGNTGNITTELSGLMVDVAQDNSSTSGTTTLAIGVHINRPTSTSGRTTTNQAGLQIERQDSATAPATTVYALRTMGTTDKISFGSKFTTYNSIATVSNGVPSELATVDLTAQTAAITATTIYAVPAAGAGTYRVSFVAKVTTAASASSTLGGTAGFQVKYTDQDDSVVVTTGAITNISGATLTGNTTQIVYAGSFIANCKLSTNLQYLIDYTSVGGTAMQYNLHIKVEAL